MADRLINVMTSGNRSWQAVLVLLSVLSVFGCATARAGSDEQAEVSPAGYDELMAAVDAGGCAALEKAAGDGARPVDGTDALFVAAQKGCLEACRMILDKGFAPDSATDSGETPLMAAIFTGNTDVAQLLCERGADIAAARNDGATALYLATYVDNEKAVDKVVELFRAKMDAEGVTGEAREKMMADYVSRAQENGWTPLMNAAMIGNLDMIRKLVGLGADLNARESRGFTARFLAEHAEKDDAMKLIIELGGTY